MSVMSSSKIDELIEGVTKLIPDDLNKIKGEVKQNLKSALTATLSKMELVTREEFDIQSALLARTRAKLDEMQSKLDELENRLNK